jgi:hypothetical protein
MFVISRESSFLSFYTSVYSQSPSRASLNYPSAFVDASLQESSNRYLVRQETALTFRYRFCHGLQNSSPWKSSRDYETSLASGEKESILGSIGKSISLEVSSLLFEDRYETSSQVSKENTRKKRFESLLFSWLYSLEDASFSLKSNSFIYS